MRTGPILAEPRSVDVDRRDVSYPLWEEGAAAAVDLPWAEATSLASATVISQLAGARTAMVVGGKGAAASALLAHCLANLPPTCRLYVYGPRAWEAHATIGPKLASMAARVLPRLGFDTPADWLVVDGGRAALLLVGPAAAERRWLLRLDGPLARTLHEAGRTLFWFHAVREGLPDEPGSFGFRTPLPAPFPDPGATVALAAGIIAFDRVLTDPIADAEIRVASGAGVSGRAQIVFIRPDARDFATPTRLARDLARVVWTDAGLPPISVSRERFVMQLDAAPISLQLEWPRAAAIDLYHRLARLGKQPAWQFHPQRRLADVGGHVLLAGAASAPVKDQEVIDVPDVTGSLDAFDQAEPTTRPMPSQLVRTVTYRWRVVPPTVPLGAKEAELVRGWRVLDEWARRQVDTLRQALTTLETEERGVLDRLRAWWSGHDDVRAQRGRLRAGLDELGEAPPSQLDDAASLIARIVTARRDTRAIVESAHGSRALAEEGAARAEQQAAWDERQRALADELALTTGELAALQARESTAIAEAEAAENALQVALEASRAAHKVQLIEDRDRVAAELELARAEHEALKDGSKPQRKEAARKRNDLEQRLARANRDLDRLTAWSPQAPALAQERDAMDRASSSRAAARVATSKVESEIRRVQVIAGESFAFTPPPRREGPQLPQDTEPPAVPSEALPELGELFEHQGQRYLAVKTWEQVRQAIPVAGRLKATLVSAVGKKA